MKRSISNAAYFARKGWNEANEYRRDLAARRKAAKRNDKARLDKAQRERDRKNAKRADSLRRSYYNNPCCTTAFMQRIYPDFHG